MKDSFWQIKQLSNINEDCGNWGGKAVALHKAQKLNISIPACIVIPANIHQKYQVQGGFNESEWDMLRPILREYFLPLQPLMVRSSANIENTTEFASCGLFESYRVDSIESVPAAIESVWDSLNARGVDNYLQMIGLSRESVHIAIIIQAYFEGVIGGVIHTRDQVGNSESIFVEYIVGKGMNAVVDGNENAELSIFDRNGNITTGTSLTNPHLSLLKETVLESIRLEEYFRSGLEIEFQISDQQIAILQVREVGGL